MKMGETTSVRSITVEGYKFDLQCKDPYGYWVVKQDSQGKSTTQPTEISGVFFTSLTEAEKAIDAVVSKKVKKDVSKFKKEVVNPNQEPDTDDYKPMV